MARSGSPGLRALALACLVLAGCDSGMFDFVKSYRFAPPGGKTTLLTFTTPSMPFDNPAKGESSGFAPGNWVAGNGKLTQTQGAADNLANHLRYTGDAFGTSDGRAGRVYSVSVDCSVAKEADSPAVAGFPDGILAMMPYYKDPTHYVLLVGSHQNLSCWVVNGYRPAGQEWPQEARVWDQWLETPLDASSSVRWGADVDCDHHSLKIYVNDQSKAARTIPMISNAPHWVALAANGNYEQFSNLKLTWQK
jgi:hypothetical protein